MGSGSLRSMMAAISIMVLAGCAPGFQRSAALSFGSTGGGLDASPVGGPFAAITASGGGPSGWAACVHEKNTTTYRSCYVVLQLATAPQAKANLSIVDQAGQELLRQDIGVVAEARAWMWVPDGIANDLRTKPLRLVLRNAGSGTVLAEASLRSIVLTNHAGRGSGKDVLYHASTWSNQNWGRALSDAVLSRETSEGTLAVTSSVALAGAIGSLRLNGQEYVSTGGHGASLQFAVYPLRKADGYPSECYNPTEAGNQEDDHDLGGFTGADHSTSYLHEFALNGGVLRSLSNIAWYTPLGAVSGWAGQCENVPVTWANGNRHVSGYWLRKSTSLEKYPGFDNVVHVDTTISAPERLERLALGYVHYATRDFSRVFSYDAKNDRLVEIGVTDPDYNYLERAEILIVATWDLAHSFAVRYPTGYDTGVPLERAPGRVWIWGESWNKPGYDFGDYRAHSSVFYFKGMAPGSEAKFKLDLVVGGIEKVRTTLRRLEGAAASDGSFGAPDPSATQTRLPGSSTPAPTPTPAPTATPASSQQSNGACAMAVSEADYLAMYPDVRAAGMSPYYHYSVWGKSEGRCPVTGACLVPVTESQYLDMYPDVKSAGMAATAHYQSYGKNEGRCPVK